ncbi:hypothetical protein OG481_00080 [Streptomyces longwoodensis]|uniref:hypothetical protein n=1 Tax=Streptomyces longwoodensis TaxID=68231 RepID=UPI002DDAB5DD|nr:hypothetical protein [Streptomyces longwoodensis]WRY93237.1 hypothetical protein OG481_00080 [Streptomyces longwoodensis]
MSWATGTVKGRNARLGPDPVVGRGPDGCGKAFAAAAAIFRETGGRRREAEAWGNLGLARSAGPEPDGQALETAAALFRETGDLDDERRALLHRARLGRPADGQKQD